MTDEHQCPKCESDLSRVQGSYALVEYVDRDSRGKDGMQINPKSALPLEVYYCESCRRVELVAG